MWEQSISQSLVKAHLYVLNAELLRCVHSYRLSVDVREIRECRTAVVRKLATLIAERLG